MKKGLIVFVVVMLLGGLAYPLLKGTSGYILIAYNHTTIEMSIWIGLLIFLVVVFAIKILWQLLSGGRRVAYFFSSSGARASVRAQQRTTEALVDAMAGNWSSARKSLVKNASKSPDALVNYLAAAHCSRKLNDVDGALELLHKAEEAQINKNNYDVAIIQAKTLFDDKRYEQSLATLNRIKRSAPEHTGMLDLLVDVYWALEDYESLQGLLPKLETRGVRTNSEIEQLELKLLKLNFSKICASGVNKNLEENKHTVEHLWGECSSKLQKTPSAMTIYGTALHELNCEVEAEIWLLKSIKKQWSDNAVVIFGRIESNNPTAQLQMATRWLTDHKDNAALFCALGRISMRNELWGKARDFFQQSIVLDPMPEVYAVLAELLHQLGEHEAANALYKEGLYNMCGASQKKPK